MRCRGNVLELHIKSRFTI